MNIVISGIGRGIGKAIALKYIEFGHTVIGCTKSIESKTNVIDEIINLDFSGDLKIIDADISKADGVESFYSFIKENIDSIDVLINNTGVFLGGNMLNESENELMEMLNTNLLSAYRLSKKVIPSMIENGSGQIINICSVAALQGYPSGGSYAISKHALLGFTRSLREELKDKNIKVTAVHPGATFTDSWNGVDLPAERFIPVEDIADLVYSISVLSKYSVVEDIVIRPQLGDI